MIMMIVMILRLLTEELVLFPKNIFPNIPLRIIKKIIERDSLPGAA